MAFQFGTKSKTILAGVHPDLKRVMVLALSRSPLDFTVLEGRRTLSRQKLLLRKGATTTLNSRHLTGHAVDVAPMIGGKVRWDWPLYHKLALTIKKAAKDLKVNIRWGGDWKSFKDGPHWELPK